MRGLSKTLLLPCLSVTMLVLPAVLLASQYQVARVVDGDTIRVRDGMPGL